MSAKKPAMRDIARAVGTSAVTVSKALAGKTGMSDRLRTRILRKAEEMGYRYPQSGQRVLPEHMNIGILIPERYFQADSFYAEMYRKLIRRLSGQGHFGLLEILNAKDEQELTMPNLLKENRADGLILLGEPEKAYYRKIALTGTPVVFLDFYDEQANADAVAGDNCYGSYRLTSHLIRQGHREIGFVGTRLATASIMDRYLGYCRAMLTHGLPIREEWTLPDREPAGDLKAPELPEKMPTAFVCNCDLAARLLIDRLQERGFRVPEDISVTGFDDYPPGRENETGLSTFRINTDEMIDLAIRKLLERCAGTDQPFGRMVVGGQPVYRESEKALNTSGNGTNGEAISMACGSAEG